MADGKINDKDELAKKLNLPFGIPDAVLTNPYEVTLNEELQEIYVTKVLNKELEIFKAEQTVTLHGQRPDLVGRVEEGDTAKLDAMRRLLMLTETQRRFTRFGKPREKLKAERKANRKLRSLLSEEQYLSYELSGAFWEDSKRRRIRYLVRKNRPTLVFKVRKRNTILGFYEDKLQTGTMDELTPKCALCIHGVGYYTGTYAGLMTPTDDVINVVHLIRIDEKGFWAKAIQHEITEPVAGIG